MSLLKKVLIKASGNQVLQNMLEKTAKTAQYYMGIGSGDAVLTSGERAVIEKMLAVLPSPYCIFDVGSNTGQFLNLVLNRMINAQCQIHCFEPSPQAFAMLSQSVTEKINHFIRLNPIGLGKEAGEVTLYSNEPGSQLASLTKRRLDHMGINFSQTQIINIDTLDHYCATNDIDRIDLLKVDVEGHELDVLQSGGARMFEKGAIKLVSFEFGGCNIDTRTYFQDFYYFFQDAHMILFRITPSGYLYRLSRYKEIFEQFQTTNFLAIHESLPC